MTDGERERMMDGESEVSVSNNESFGEYMTSTRKARELKAKDVAQVIEISPQYFADMESGGRLPPSNAIVTRWSDAIGADIWTAQSKALYERSGDYQGMLAALFRETDTLDRDDDVAGVLARHQDDGWGNCTSCKDDFHAATDTYTPLPWPCDAARMAMRLATCANKTP